MRRRRPDRPRATRRHYFSERVRGRTKAWLLQHAQAAVFSLGQLVRSPLASAMTVAVLGIALALPAGFHVMLDNARRVTAGWETTLQIALYLKRDVPPHQAAELADTLRADAAIDTVRYISREEALEEFRSLSGLGDSIDALGENPLPAVLLIRPAGAAMETATYDPLLARLARLPEVEEARFDREWLRRLQAIIATVQRAVGLLGAVLGLGVLLIVGNTIRLNIFNRRSEIEINKLFGATDAFIRRPFLYSGAWYGLLGSLFAWLLVTAAILLLRGPVGALADLYASEFRLAGLSLLQCLGLFGAGIGLGLAGSWLAVQRHLRAIEPA